jgi:hypothetical protein
MADRAMCNFLILCISSSRWALIVIVSSNAAITAVILFIMLLYVFAVQSY